MQGRPLATDIFFINHVSSGCKLKLDLFCKKHLFSYLKQSDILKVIFGFTPIRQNNLLSNSSLIPFLQSVVVLVQVSFFF